MIYIYFDRWGSDFRAWRERRRGSPTPAPQPGRTDHEPGRSCSSAGPSPPRCWRSGLGWRVCGALFLLPVAPLPNIDHSHHRGQRQHGGRQPRSDGRTPWRRRWNGIWARSPMSREMTSRSIGGFDPDRAAVRHQPRHRRRGARRAGRDQCGACRSARLAEIQSHLPQVQSRRLPDHDPGADLQDADARARSTTRPPTSCSRNCRRFPAWAMLR